MQQELIGKRLGNYQIEGHLGRGGMALVYKALDVTLKRPAAIKVIAPDMTEDRHQERFEREAQAIAALDHPHIVPVYYFGKSKALYYLAMKYIEGESLETLITRYAAQGELLPTSDIVRIMEGVASALDYAHSKGVIHRDVKPSNIMLDSSGHPYLTDFGLAMNVKHGSVGDTFGTPHYISPEQATSSASAVPQSDLYSLGVVLYELFTGVIPFDDPSPMVAALHHITLPPPAPRALNPQLAPAVEQVILKALDKQPEGRYQTGAKLVSALRGALRGTGKRDKTGELPALPAGVKKPPARQMSERPVAAEVKTLLSERAQLPKSAPNRPKSSPAPRSEPVAASQAARPRSRRGLRIVLLVLLVLLLGSFALFLTQQDAPVLPIVPILPVAAAEATATPAPDNWEVVQFVYDENSFWWVNPSARQFVVVPIRFARADDSAEFWGQRWTVFYPRVEARSCVRVSVKDAEERMPRPAECRSTNADLLGNADEIFWTGSAEFYIYWRGERVAVCASTAGRCEAALPPE